jgi:fluoride exporter
MARQTGSHLSASYVVRTLVLIGTGGFIGSILRYLLSGYVQQVSKGFQFPFGTLAVNVVGCVLVGFLAELADQRSLISDETRGFLIVGILGGFTTFSAFGNETMNLLRSGELWLAGANIIGHMLLSLIAVWIGYSTAALIWKL